VSEAYEINHVVTLTAAGFRLVKRSALQRDPDFGWGHVYYRRDYIQQKRCEALACFDTLIASVGKTLCAYCTDSTTLTEASTALLST
jgi:hypothetical protein